MMNDNSSVSDDYHNFESAPQGSDDTNLVAGNVSGSAPTWLIYLKTGTTYSVSDYWLQGGRLHYTVNYGAPSTLKMQEVDLQRTVDENARCGIGVLLCARFGQMLSLSLRGCCAGALRLGIATTFAAVDQRQAEAL
jgi:hypothetical protein